MYIDQKLKKKKKKKKKTVKKKTVKKKEKINTFKKSVSYYLFPCLFSRINILTLCIHLSKVSHGKRFKIQTKIILVYDNIHLKMANKKNLSLHTRAGVN